MTQHHHHNNAIIIIIVVLSSYMIITINVFTGKIYFYQRLLFVLKPRWNLFTQLLFLSSNQNLNYPPTPCGLNSSFFVVISWASRWKYDARHATNPEDWDETNLRLLTHWKSLPDSRISFLSHLLSVDFIFCLLIQILFPYTRWHLPKWSSTIISPQTFLHNYHHNYDVDHR